MTVRDNLLPIDGVTIYEEAVGNRGSAGRTESSWAKKASEALTDRRASSFYVSKRGKPFTKMASNKESMRMTRQSYFKIAESQGLKTLREPQISINESIDIGARSRIKLSTPLTGWPVM